MMMNQMMIAVFSDVHGNMPALEAIISELDKENVERILVAGDLIGGPNPNEAIELLKSLGCIIIAGNMDLDLLCLTKGTAPNE